MGKCDACGNKSMLLKTFRCKMCEKEVCKKCAVQLLTVRLHGPGFLERQQTWYVCSEQCFENFAKRISEQRPLTTFSDLARAFVFNVANSSEKRKWLGSNFADILARGYHDDGAPVYFTVYPPQDNPGLAIWKQFENESIQQIDQNRKSALLKEANIYETSGRFEEAAARYEQLGMYEDAGRIRARARRIPVTQVTVNLNTLLQQVKDSGIVAVYRCPHCGGALRIAKETSISSLKNCVYCGSQIEAIDLADFLKTVLS